MRLDVASFPVRRAELGARTRYADGVLTIGVEAVRSLVLQDPRVRDVRLEVVHPGDSARVLRPLDAIEPLRKVEGPGSAFPGFNGPPHTCGRGRTHRLEGFSVVEVAEFPFPASGVQAVEEGIIEMTGPGAAYAGCADRVNLLLVCTPGPASSNDDYDDAVRRAGLRVADHLAGATIGLEPVRVERFELAGVRPGLPRVVWVHQVRNQGPMVRTFLYGHEMANLVPTVLHPNELLDGALVGANYKTGTKTPTYMHTRHPSLESLYARHGRDLEFVGVVVSRGHHENEFLKERSAHFVAKLAGMLRADGALCTYEATGNTHVDFMLTVQALERAGIRTGAVVHEYGGPEGTDAPLVDFAPEAIALASSGGIDRRIRLPAVERLIGGTHLAHRGIPAGGEIEVSIQELYAVTAEMNRRGVVAQEY
ncbi:MAG TPA: glycine/sarcosine/betaine reductase component B subunit [Thermodesulfobacteriota bacterium]